MDNILTQQGERTMLICHCCPHQDTFDKSPQT